MSSLPIFDFENLNQANLQKAMEEVGFFYLKNHGVPKSLQDKLSDLSHQFFAEPEDFKNQIHMKKAGQSWRGYFPVGEELTSGKPDIKEGIYFGVEHGHNQFPLHGSNQWPPGPKYKEFQRTVLTYLQALSPVGHKLMEQMDVDVDLSDPTLLFRIFNYPPSKEQWGVQEHTDMGFLTLLLQDASGGLEVKAVDDTWIEVPPIENTFVVNIGDMLQLFTGGKYRATPHRVKNLKQKDRLSFPFFFDPGWTIYLEPLGMTYGDYVWDKVTKVFPQLGP